MTPSTHKLRVACALVLATCCSARSMDEVAFQATLAKAKEFVKSSTRSDNDELAKKLARQWYFVNQLDQIIDAKDATGLKELLAEFPDQQNNFDRPQNPFLIRAVETGDAATVEVMLSLTTDVNGLGPSRNSTTASPLHVAVCKGFPEVAKVLLEHKASPNLRDGFHDTPLHCLFDRFNPEYVSDRAYAETQMQLARLLVTHGAKIFATNRFGATVCDLALRRERRGKPSEGEGQPTAIDVLLSEGDFKERDSGNNSVVELAAKYGRIPALTRLVERKVDLTATNSAGLTPLQIAVFAGQQQTAEWLLGHDVPLDLFSAVALGRLGPAQLLAAENPTLLRSTNAHGDTVLHWAAKREDKGIGQWLLKENVPIDTQNQSGETPLHQAARQKNFLLAQLLIAHAARIDLRTTDGASALDFAAQSGDKEIADLLLQAGAEINPTNKNAKVPLHSAVLGQNQGIVEALLERGADINARDVQGQTALHVSAARGDSKEVSLLVSRGADISARNRDGKTAVDLAGNPDVIQILISHKPPTEKGADLETRNDKRGRTRFLIAAENNDYDSAESLLKLGADINARDAEGNTALHYCAMWNYQWDEGSEAERSDSQNVVPAPIWVRYRGNFGKYLLDRGADTHMKNNLGRTPLHMIGLNTTSGEGAVPTMTAAVKLLLKYGADINAKDEEGRTPLHLAAVKGAELSARILLANGADRNAKDNLGRTPLLAAAGANLMRDEHPSEEVLQLLATNKTALRDMDADGNTPLHLAARANNVRQIDVLLVQGADKAATNKFGQTPLYLAMQDHTPWAMDSLFPKGATKDIFQAASSGDLASVKALLEFDPNLASLTNFSGGTPLHAAVQTKRREIVELLLKYPVNINARDFSGRTPLHAAAWNDAKEVVQLLIAHNANTQIKDRSGRTAAELALSNPKVMARRAARKEFIRRYWICVPVLLVLAGLPWVIHRRIARQQSLRAAANPSKPTP